MVTTANLESAGKQVVELLRSDILRYMTTEAAQMILEDFKEHLNQSRVSPAWSPNWFEKQIVKAQRLEENEKQEEPQVKRKKTATENKQSTSTQQTTNNPPHT
jgi:hypothetical protein